MTVGAVENTGFFIIVIDVTDDILLKLKNIKKIYIKPFSIDTMINDTLF